MEGLVLLVSLVTLASSHYSGYPFEHQNSGRYGAQYRVANYKGKDQGAAPAKSYTAGQIVGKLYGFVPGGAVDKDSKLEFDFRKHGGFPVHIGNGQFFFLGAFSDGSCRKTSPAGFYFTGDEHSYVVCENGRTHRFDCPKGTKNKESAYFQHNKAYSQADLCSEFDGTA